MKSRVALFVTLVSLVVLALLFTYNCSKLADEANDEIRKDLSIVCQVTGDFSRSDTVEDRVRTLQTLDVGEGTAKGLFDAEGNAIYVSKDGYEQISADGMAMATVDKAVVYQHANPEGKPAIYAIYQYEDGAFLAYAEQKMGILQVLGKNKSLVLLAVIFGLSMVLFAYVLAYMVGRERRVRYSFSWVGASLIRPSCFLASRRRFFSSILSPRNALFTLVSTVVRMASMPEFRFTTAGLFSEEVRSRRFRSTISVLY